MASRRPSGTSTASTACAATCISAIFATLSYPDRRLPKARSIYRQRLLPPSDCTEFYCDSKLAQIPLPISRVSAGSTPLFLPPFPPLLQSTFYPVLASSTFPTASLPPLYRLTTRYNALYALYALFYNINAYYLPLQI